MAGLRPGQTLFIMMLMAMALRAEAQVTVYERPQAPTLQLAVYVPDTVETFASRYNTERSSTGTAQGIIEQQLIDSGYGVAALNTAEDPSRSDLLNQCMSMAVEYLIYGEVQAGQILSSESGSISGGVSEATRSQRTSAWGGINKPEQTAAISIQVISVPDERIVAVKNASSGQSVQAQAGGIQGAIADAAKRLMRNLLPELADLQQQQTQQTKRQVIEIK
jgi:hypothetical protein